MKKIIRFYVIILAAILSCSVTQSYKHSASAASTDTNQNYGYYKALSSCLLFKTSDVSNMDITNVLFIIPEGYFVKKISEISTTTMKVSYNNISGYVMTERVKLVSFLPQIKYVEGATFDIVQSSGTQVWKIPSSENIDNVLYAHVEAGTTNINYIAEARGEIPVGSTSSIWYYCYFSPESEPTSVYAGYIHKEKTTNLTPIPVNTEDDIVIKNDVTTTESDTLNLGTTIKTILICLISLPLLSIIIVLLLSSRRKAKLKKVIDSSEITENRYDTDDEIVRAHTRDKKITDLKNKKYSIKEKFNDFVFEEESEHKPQFSFKDLNFDEDEDLL